MPTAAHHCPTCKRSFSGPGRAIQAWPAFPFCSSRCQMVDLGKWLDESYRVSEPLTEDRLEELEAEGVLPPHAPRE